MTPDDARNMGINKPRVVNGQLVKQVKDSGNPHAEAAAADVFRTLGVPHIPARVVAPDVSAHPFHPDFRPVGTLKPGDLTPDLVAHATSPDTWGPLVLSEYLMGATDRHGGNYGLTGEHGLVSIDHGQAFHEHGNLNYPYTTVFQDEWQPGWSLAADPYRLSPYHPNSTALARLQELLGVPYSRLVHQVIPSRFVDAALASGPQLDAAARLGTTGLPEQERVLATRAMRLRLDALRGHRGPLTWHGLGSLSHQVREQPV